MNLSSLLSAPIGPGLQSGGLPPGPMAGLPAGSTLSGMFDALVTANAAVVAGPSALSPLLSTSSVVTVSEMVEPVPVTPIAGNTTAPAPTDLAVLSAATMEMLSALDRSATMLSRPRAGNPISVTAGKDERPVATDPASPGDGGSAIPSPQTAALISAFMAIGRALPIIVSTPEEYAVDTNTAKPSAPKAASPAPPMLPAAAAAMPALFNAIASELRPMLGAKADLADKAVDAILEPVKDSADGVSVVSPTSAMIRDLASMIANSVSPSAPTDTVAVDRHLDLARDDAWLNDLAHDIAATAANGGRLKFGLAPESLGRLDVEIRQGAAGVSVHMTTRTDTARDVLTAAQPRIVDEIRAQGVRVAGTEVSTDASGSGAGFGGDRAGSTPHQPLALPIDVALSVPNAAPSKPPESVADGRYA